MNEPPNEGMKALIGILLTLIKLLDKSPQRRLEVAEMPLPPALAATCILFFHKEENEGSKHPPTCRGLRWWVPQARNAFYLC
jgi:hypothetical protein